MNNFEKTILYILLSASVFLGVINMKSDGNLGAYIDSGQVTHLTDLNVTNDLVVSGSLTTSGSTSSVGIATISAGSTGNTLKIGSAGTASCLEMGDNRGANYPLVYVSVASSTVSATTTKPSYCL